MVQETNADTLPVHKLCWVQHLSLSRQSIQKHAWVMYRCAYWCDPCGTVTTLHDNSVVYLMLFFVVTLMLFFGVYLMLFFVTHLILFFEVTLMRGICI